MHTPLHQYYRWPPLCICAIFIPPFAAAPPYHTVPPRQLQQSGIGKEFITCKMLIFSDILVTLLSS